MTSRPARLNVKIFISRDNFLLGCRKSKTFTHCILIVSSTYICWTSPFVILGVFFLFYPNFDGKSY